jgi:uncharacterized protein
MGNKQRSIRISPGSIKVQLPNVVQHSNFTCGAAALQAVCAYFGVGPDTEYEYVKELGTWLLGSTNPEDIVSAAKRYGLQAFAKEDMASEELKGYLDEEKPVIVCLQAYGNPKYYRKYERSGHYIVAIGYDSRHLFFEDPSLYGHRGSLTYRDFERRWHDIDAFGKFYNHHGIVLWKNGDPAYIHKARRIT